MAGCFFWIQRLEVLAESGAAHGLPRACRTAKLPQRTGVDVERLAVRWPRNEAVCQKQAIMGRRLGSEQLLQSADYLTVKGAELLQTMRFSRNS
jgi:hypothetical protein